MNSMNSMNILISTRGDGFLGSSIIEPEWTEFPRKPTTFVSDTTQSINQVIVDFHRVHTELFMGFMRFNYILCILKLHNKKEQKNICWFFSSKNIRSSWENFLKKIISFMCVCVCHLLCSNSVFGSINIFPSLFI